MPAGVLLRRITVNAGTSCSMFKTSASMCARSASWPVETYRSGVRRFGSTGGSTPRFSGGAAADSNLTATSKGLLAQGTVDVHGKLYAPTWTRLANPAATGDSTIFLGQSTNWEVGQEVLITTTGWFDCPAQWGSYCVPCFGWQTAQPLVFNCHQ